MQQAVASLDVDKRSKWLLRWMAALEAVQQLLHKSLDDTCTYAVLLLSYI